MNIFFKIFFTVMAVFVLVIFNVYLVEAKSLKKGDAFIATDSTGESIIRIVSSVELEFAVKRSIFGVLEKKYTIIEGKYTIDGNRMRITVTGFLGATQVMYFEITQAGLKEENDGTIYVNTENLSRTRDKKYYTATLNSDAKNAYTAAQAILSDNPSATPTCADLRTKGYVASSGVACFCNITSTSGSVSVKGLTAWGLRGNTATVSFSGVMTNASP